MKFTWVDKFTRTIERIPDDLLPAFVRALTAYGTDGVEPELDFPLDAIFESLRDDIDYSHAARETGAAGGRVKRGRKREAGQEPESELVITVACDDEGPCEQTADAERVRESPSDGAQGCGTTLANDAKGCAGPLAGVGTQSNALHSSALQKEEEKKGAPRAVSRKPPTPDEVKAYAFSAGLRIDPEAFCDFYSSKGWKVGKEPMRDWKAAARYWARSSRAPARGAPERGSGDAYSRL